MIYGSLFLILLKLSPLLVLLLFLLLLLLLLLLLSASSPPLLLLLLLFRLPCKHLVTIFDCSRRAINTAFSTYIVPCHSTTLARRRHNINVPTKPRRYTRYIFQRNPRGRPLLPHCLLGVAPMLAWYFFQQTLLARKQKACSHTGSNRGPLGY